VNTNDPHNDAAGVETLLHRTLTMRDTAWEAARVRFVSRAASSGLVDVGYEDHETPLGTVRINATRRSSFRATACCAATARSASTAVAPRPRNSF
jgi:methylated-DNA-[protein]-cysteine S-methyltransferase